MAETQDPGAVAPPPEVDVAGKREIAPGVWVVPDRRVPLVPNIGIVEGRRSVLVVDTGMGPENGRRVFEAARALAGGRRLFLTLTHFHPEHGFGAQAFATDAVILYNRAQADELAAKGQGYLAMFQGMGPGVAAALDGTALVAPHIAYEGPRCRLDLGGRRVELVTWGTAHTRGDQVVHLPDEAILFTGDLAEESTFPIFPWFPPDDADIDATGWVAALADCVALRPRIVVPGHGEVGGGEILAAVRDYMLALEAEVGRRRADGLDGEALAAAIRPGVLARHPGWHFPEWIDFAIRYYATRG